MTANDLLSVEMPGKWTELDRGQLVVREPPGAWHGMVSARLTYLLGDFVYRQNLGVLCGQDTGFKIESAPDTVRAPDLAFVRSERASAIERRGYAALAPDLIAEVVSPHDRPGEVLTRAGMWLEAGVRLVWVIDPDRQVAHVHRPDGSVTVVGIDGTLDGESVLPGLLCPLAEILRTP
jgi:Uma2 family endonuclease